MRAIALLLSNRQYILDTKEATVYDTDVYAIVAHFFFEPMLGGMKWVQTIRAQHSALEPYIVGLRHDELYITPRQSRSLASSSWRLKHFTYTSAL
jgi:hypothetical protein